MKYFSRITLILYPLIMIGIGCSQGEIGDVDAGSIPTPESIIGFKPGSDYKMANWDQIYAYFKQIDAASDRIEVLELGETEQGRPMIAALISSPANLRNKENLKEIQRKLADPRLTTDDELPDLIEDGTAVVLITCSLHATELGATQASLLVAYQMATDNGAVMKEILKNVVLVYFLAANPDGVQMTAEHYMNQNPGPGVQITPLPRIYSEYTGHDNNRDWYMLTQKESMIIGKQMYEEWFPEIVFDMHQKGGGARIFVPPFSDPLNPLIHPLIVRELEMLGGYMTIDLIAGGYPWVEDQRGFTMWWHGGMRTAPYFHNMVGILSEVASANLATPQLVPEERRMSAQERIMPEGTINYPVPWTDDRDWRLSDIVEQDRIVLLAVLKTAARNKDMFMNNYYIMNKEAIEKGASEEPFAFVMPADQHDRGAMVYFLETMLKQDTDFEIAVEEFTAGGKNYPAGSIIVYLSQPARQHVLGIMGTQLYPADRRPYDITGWTLPLQMGVEYDRIDKPFTASTKPYTKAEPISIEFKKSDPKVFYIGGNSIDHYRAVNNLFNKDHELSIVTGAVTVDGHNLPPGSIVLNNTGTASQDIEDLKSKLSLTVVESDEISNLSSVSLRRPRIGLVNDPNSMPVGWMRWVLEKHEFDFDLVDFEDFEQGGLNENYDVLLITVTPPFPGERRGRGGRGQQQGQLSAEQQREEEERQRRLRSARETFGSELKKFVNEGGTVVSWSNSVRDIVQALNLRINPVAVDGDRFSVPGSVLRINVDASHPVTYGMQEEVFIFFRNNTLLRANQGRILGRYPDSNPLVSGYLLGSESIQNTPNIIHLVLGKGKVIIAGFEPMFRAQPVGTFKIVFNSILYSTMPAVR